MNITSLVFFLFVLISVFLYYVFPKNFRWVVLFAANILFLQQANSLKMLIFWAICALFTYAIAVMIEKKKANKKLASFLTFCGVAVVMGSMVVLKDSSFFVGILNGVLKIFHVAPVAGVHFNSPLGISYYSLIWTGYILGVYWGDYAAEKNVFKFITFAGFFPVYVSGPVVKFAEVEESIVTGHAFEYKNLTFGMQRVLWGLMKKLILSERLAIVVNTIYSDTYLYPGFYVWIAMIAFVFQLYTDFSGCIDIVLGVAEMFGIRLPENFTHPFMSLTMAEFWRNWHITLGGWLRDYILYPTLKSAPFQRLGKFTKSKFGKKLGKQIPTWIGLLISWFLIGFWHGGQWNYILGVGVFCGIIIIVSEILAPLFVKVKAVLKVNEKTFSYRLFQRLRTFFLFMVALSFFRAYDGFKVGLVNWKNALTVYNPWIFTDGSLMELGLDAADLRICFVFGLILAVSGIVTFVKRESLRELVARQNYVFRWAVYLLLLYAVIIYGCYGINFSSAAFIYQRF